MSAPKSRTLREARAGLGSRVERWLATLASPGVTRLWAEPLFHVLGLRRRPGVDLQRASALLVVRLDEIGDFVLTSALIRELRREAPRAWITLAVRPSTFELAEWCPYVDEVVVFDPAAQGRFRLVRLHARALELARRRLWRRRFDLAIVPRFDFDDYHATFLAYLSGARGRVAYTRAVEPTVWGANVGIDRLLTHPLASDGNAHEVKRSLAILVSLGGAVRSDRLETWVGEDDERSAEHLLEQAGARRVVCLAPGAGAPRRRWPIDRFAAIGASLVEAGAHVVVLGSAADAAFGRALAAELGDRLTDLTGRTSLRESAALLRRCSLFVGNDSGPMHLAAAAGVPVVEISSHADDAPPDGMSSYLRFGPWGVRSVIARPRHARSGCTSGCVADEPHCILDVPLDDVRQATFTLMDLAGSQPL